jgi:galactonate dehydratase
MNAMTLHLSAAIPNFSIFETVMIDAPWRRELVKQKLEFENGDIMIPAGPGLGVELNEEACGNYPYQPTDVPIFNGRMSTEGLADGRPALDSDRRPR